MLLQIKKYVLSLPQVNKTLHPRIALFFFWLCISLVAGLTDPLPCHADFTIVVYPDSHVDAGTTNLPIWQAQNEWVVNNTSARNIVAVLGVGDIVTDSSAVAYNNATVRGYDFIHYSGLPYLPLVGNHDYDNIAERATGFYDEVFGPMRFAVRSWYLGGYPTDSNANLAIKFDVDERKYLVLGLEFFPRESAVSWAQGMIDANPDREVIVVTHAYLTKAGSLYQDGDNYGPAAYGLTQDYSGQELWDNFIKHNSRIFLVIGGHDICSPNNAHMISSGVNGNIVSQIQCNYQCHPNGGDGYILLLKVKPIEKVIEVTPYSTHLAANDPNYPPYILSYHPSAPTITDASVGAPPPSGITLRAMVNDNGALTSVNFEYGLTTDYGTTLAGGTVNAGSGIKEILTNIAWLAPGAYHARAVASNIAGTVTSNDFSFTIPTPSPTWPITLTFNGSGNGFVNSTPAVLACYASCYAILSANSTVNLIAVPDSFSVFNGWSGDCSGLDCSLTMDGVKSVSAEFTAVPPVMVGTIGYQNLLDAFIDTNSDATVKALAVEFYGDLVLNRDISIYLDGGYAGNYIDHTGMTTLNACLTIEKGTITINNVIFQ